MRDQPVVLVDPDAPRGPQVVLCVRKSELLGMRSGMPLAEATSLESSLCAINVQADRDRQALRRLATWSERYTPIIALDEGVTVQGLALDVSGCAACFGGEDRLLEKMEREIRGQGLFPRVVIAPTLGAAWAIACHGMAPATVQNDDLQRVLPRLPVAALRLSPETLATLAHLGIDRIEQLLALPREELPARLGPEVLMRLDQALGRLPEPLAPCRAVPNVQAGYCFPHAVDRLDHLHQVLDHLLERIHHDLETRQEGARGMACWLHFENTPSLPVGLRLYRATRNVQHLSQLMRTCLEQVRLPEPAYGMSLRVTEAGPLRSVQEQFTEPPSPGGLPTLIDSLSCRLGSHAITRAILAPDPQPEFAYRCESVVDSPLSPCGRGAGGEGAKAGRLSTPHPNPSSQRGKGVRPSSHAKGKKLAVPEDRFFPFKGLRPLRVLPKPVEVPVLSVVPDGPPIRFTWGKTSYRIERVWGPERIETGWWRDHDVNRDYYRIATDQGNRYWLFRRRTDGRWFIHGCFD